MSDIHQYAWLGAMALVPTALMLLLGGMGWRKLAQALALLLTVPLVGAALVTVVALKLAHDFGIGGGSGEWKGLGQLFIAVLAGGATFLLLVVLTLLWQLRSKRMTVERAPSSRLMLILGSIAAVVAAVSVADIVIGFTPSMAPTQRLVRQLGHGGEESPVEAELVRRGPQAVPVIVAELHRHPFVKSNEDVTIDLTLVPPLLRVLGRIGGTEATAELRRWTAKEVPAYVRAVAIDVLATHGDRSVIPLIVEMLGNHANNDFLFLRPELFHALGVLKAGDQVGLIRAALASDRTGSTSHLRPVVTALAAIDTDDAWALISDLAANQNAYYAEEVVRALEKCPSPRTLALLGKVLDSPEPTRRDAAYTALQRLEPRLLENGPEWTWSEANAGRLRAALKKRLAEKQ